MWESDSDESPEKSPTIAQRYAGNLKTHQSTQLREIWAQRIGNPVGHQVRLVHMSLGTRVGDSWLGKMLIRRTRALTILYAKC